MSGGGRETYPSEQEAGRQQKLVSVECFSKEQAEQEQSMELQQLRLPFHWPGQDFRCDGVSDARTTPIHGTGNGGIFCARP